VEARRIEGWTGEDIHLSGVFAYGAPCLWLTLLSGGSCSSGAPSPRNLSGAHPSPRAEASHGLRITHIDCTRWWQTRDWELYASLPDLRKRKHQICGSCCKAVPETSASQHHREAASRLEAVKLWNFWNMREPVPGEGIPKHSRHRSGAVTPEGD
jgi:hypothetical protein